MEWCTYFIVSVLVFDRLEVDTVQTVHETVLPGILVATQVCWVNMATLSGDAADDAWRIQLNLKQFVFYMLSLTKSVQ